MSTWTKTNLGELIQIKHGFAFKGEYFVDHKTREVLLTPGNFRIGGGFQNPKPKYYAGPIPKDYVLKPGDYVVTMTDLSKEGDTLGYPAVIPTDDNTYLLNQRIGLISMKKKGVCLDYIYYLMCTLRYQKSVVGSASGATVKHTSPKKIYEVKARITTDPKTQEQIATTLRVYDDLIENNEKRIKILEEMTQKLYTEWFVKFKFPGHEKAKFVDSGTKFGKIPERWEIRTVESLIKRIPAGKKYENKTVLETGKVPVLDQGKSGVIGFHNDKPGVDASLENPVIVFANHTCYQNLIVFPFSAIQNVLPFVPNDERSIYWLHWATKDLIEFNDYKGHWPEYIAKKFVVPNAELTQEFGHMIAPVVGLRYKLERQNMDLKEMRDLLVSQLVTGKRELK